MENETTPMGTARLWVRKKSQAKRLKRLLDKVNARCTELEAEVLELMESEKLPSSFKLDGKPVFTRDETWVSALDGDHERLSAALRDAGLVEYLPRTVNSHSLSAFIRGHKDDETGEIQDVPEQVLQALKITTRTRVSAHGI